MCCPICKFEFFFPISILGSTYGAGGGHGEGGCGEGPVNIVAGSKYRELEHCGKCGFIRLKEIK